MNVDEFPEVFVVFKANLGIGIKTGEHDYQYQPLLISNGLLSKPKQIQQVDEVSNITDFNYRIRLDSWNAKLDKISTGDLIVKCKFGADYEMLEILDSLMNAGIWNSNSLILEQYRLILESKLYIVDNSFGVCEPDSYNTLWHYTLNVRNQNLPLYDLER